MRRPASCLGPFVVSPYWLQTSRYCVQEAGLLMEGAEADTRKLLGYYLWYRSGGGRGCSSAGGQRFLVQLSAQTLGRSSQVSSSPPTFPIWGCECAPRCLTGPRRRSLTWSGSLPLPGASLVVAASALYISVRERCLQYASWSPEAGTHRAGWWRATDHIQLVHSTLLCSRQISSCGRLRPNRSLQLTRPSTGLLERWRTWRRSL
jgi:hypothetical protein